MLMTSHHSRSQGLSRAANSLIRSFSISVVRYYFALGSLRVDLIIIILEEIVDQNQPVELRLHQ